MGFSVLEWRECKIGSDPCFYYNIISRKGIVHKKKTFFTVGGFLKNDASIKSVFLAGRILCYPSGVSFLF